MDKGHLRKSVFWLLFTPAIITSKIHINLGTMFRRLGTNKAEPFWPWPNYGKKFWADFIIVIILHCDELKVGNKIFWFGNKFA